jgi:hypothetical protein
MVRLQSAIGNLQSAICNEVSIAPGEGAIDSGARREKRRAVSLLRSIVHVAPNQE